VNNKDVVSNMKYHFSKNTYDFWGDEHNSGPPSVPGCCYVCRPIIKMVGVLVLLVVGDTSLFCCGSCGCWCRRCCEGQD